MKNFGQEYIQILGLGDPEWYELTDYFSPAPSHYTPLSLNMVLHWHSFNSLDKSSLSLHLLSSICSNSGFVWNVQPLCFPSDILTILRFYYKCCFHKKIFPIRKCSLVSKGIQIPFANEQCHFFVVVVRRY